MKMIPGAGGATISNYGQYIHNCTARQMPYKVPVNSLSDVQLYIAIGTTMPSSIQYQLIHTCGASGGDIESIITSSYVVGQDTNNNWYGVFKDFSGATGLTCFVIAITVDDQIFFSEEYCIESSCNALTLIKGCYGNLDNKLSYDCEGIYFGKHATDNTALGDTDIVYKHELYLRSVEVTLSSIKNSFKQGRTRNFRTEKEKLYQFYAEFVPEWYISEIDAVFYRGEVYVDATRYLVNETGFEKIEDCKQMWKPSATFKDSCYQSFSCETDPCAPPVPDCCDPLGVDATVEAACCDPEVVSATVEGEEEGFVLRVETENEDEGVTFYIQMAPATGLASLLTPPVGPAGQTMDIDWGDGSAIESFGSSDEQFPSHNYVTPGIYDIRITVPDYGLIYAIDAEGGSGCPQLIGALGMNVLTNLIRFAASETKLAEMPPSLPTNRLTIIRVYDTLIDEFIIAPTMANLADMEAGGGFWDNGILILGFNAALVNGTVTFPSGVRTILMASTGLTTCPALPAGLLSIDAYQGTGGSLDDVPTIPAGVCFVDMRNNALPVSVVNQILIDLDTNGLVPPQPNFFNCRVRLQDQTPAAAPTGAGATAAANLTGKGWIVTTD